MKTMIIGALAIAFAGAAVAQTVPAVNPHAGHAQGQAAAPQGQQHLDHAKRMAAMPTSMTAMHKDMAAMHKDMAAMHKHCQEMMKQHGKAHGAKSGTSDAPVVSAHKDHKGQ